MEGLQMLTSTPRLRVVSNGARLSSMLRPCGGHRSFEALLHIYITAQMLFKQAKDLKSSVVGSLRSNLSGVAVDADKNGLFEVKLGNMNLE